ncbi:MAG: rhamnulokinase [Parasporobacterium sp.]|nr:rhamnulokinase [Parasporobacterium sp.]
MKDYYLAVDIGASSGRHIIAEVDNGIIKTEEIYRFDNRMDVEGDVKTWDYKYLFREILNGLKKCKEKACEPKMMAIDTWGVDYVLLDEADQVIGKSYAYRDLRTKGMDKKLYETISEKDLYARTGIQKQIFNTIYQLMADKEKEPERLTKAKRFLMVPEYLTFLLTGEKINEYTNATTTQLVNPQTFDWDYELMELIGIPTQIFKKPAEPGSIVGGFTKIVKEIVGFDCLVVLPASHDTASAVVAVPSMREHPLYISSGTWSLMGSEIKKATLSDKARLNNFTNEGGYEHRFRFLKNIMGLWMIQQLRHDYNDEFSFAKLCEMAEENKDFETRVDVNDESFLSPASMEKALYDYCEKHNLKKPETKGQMAAMVYQSLAKCYGETVKEIEAVSEVSIGEINVVGGGSKAEYLNKLTANYTKKKVVAGPGEATAIGNIGVQMIADKKFEDIYELRKAIAKSFEIKEYIPE